MKKIISALLTATLLIASSAYAAGTLEDAGKAFKSGDYAKAIQTLEPLALSGNASAQNNLGLMYKEGQVVRQDYAVAFKWFNLASAQGLSQAQYNLGIMYDTGQGVAQDHVVAVKLYKLAAAKGNVDAQSNLGALYTKGQGVVRNYVKAHMWFNLSAAKGDAVAMKNKNIIAAMITNQQLVVAQKLARECLARNYKDC